MEPTPINPEQIEKLNRLLVAAAANLSYLMNMKGIPGSVKAALKPLLCLLMGYNQELAEEMEKAAQDGTLTYNELVAMIPKALTVWTKCLASIL